MTIDTITEHLTDAPTHIRSQLTDALTRILAPLPAPTQVRVGEEPGLVTLVWSPPTHPEVALVRLELLWGLRTDCGGWYAMVSVRASNPWAARCRQLDSQEPSNDSIAEITALVAERVRGHLPCPA